MPVDASEYAYSSLCLWPEKCVGAAITPQGQVSLYDSKTGASLLDTQGAFIAFVKGMVFGEFEYESLTATPLKTSFSTSTSYYAALTPDGDVIVTSDYPGNGPDHPGLRFSREEWNKFQAGCEAGDFALCRLPVLTA